MITLLFLALFAADDPMPVIAKFDFDDGDMSKWQFSDPKAFGFKENGKGKALAVVGKSSLKPKFRSPLYYAILKEQIVEDFELTLSMKSTVKDYGHRDLCIFFGYAGPDHYYYIHMAKAADAHAHSVFLVNGADRVSIGQNRTKGVEWGDEWRKIKVVRKSAEVAVYFDDMTKPIMTAKDDTFKWGKVGVGTFDDAGMFDDLVLRGVVRRPAVK